MGCSSVAAAVRGERDVTFQRQTCGDIVLRKIAATSKAWQVSKAEAQMKRERAGLDLRCSAFAAPEDAAPQADWWADSGGAISAPKDDAPFVERAGYEDEEYDDEWDDYDEDYEYEGADWYDWYDDDAAGPSAQLPDFSPSAPMTEGGAASKKLRPKAGARGKSTDPWADSDDDDAEVVRPKARSKPKSKANPVHWPAAEDEEGQAATKIQAAQRGKVARRESQQLQQAAVAKAKSAPRTQRSKDEEPGVDSPNGTGSNGALTPSSSPTRPKAKAKRRLKSSERTHMSQEADGGGLASRSAAPSRPKAKPRTRANGSVGPRGSEVAEAIQKPAFLQETDDDDGGPVMF